ncbi:hypothetical protein AN960_16635 [Bacillus sp. FJAT-25509]|uniref:PIN-like domain-containing protein n=1 Tax=Bacillus sp. FJAT-25509 TaxID=1712029 RepID=UPI0006F80C0E|nr:PIN-like domain-containing protein [Bacillus sp. FJAT-25509]KQL36248.1 hypothetical protein AN960_16635 [Bacillus sp. FJAT-25509]
MLEKFRGFISYTEDELKDLWDKAVFVVDTNILINFYKYTTKESTQSLLDILKTLKEKGRLWIPHQVALEYFFNHEDNMFKQHEGYDLLGKELKKLKDDAKKTLSNVKSKHPYIMTDNFQFYLDGLELANEQVQDQIKREIDSLPDFNTIQKDLLSLLDGIIGVPYPQKRIDEIEKEGIVRYKNNVPPGFEDSGKKDKEGFRTYGDFRYQHLFGDLIVWKQIIDRAKDEQNSSPIILITEDRKEDWWEKAKGQIKRPHPQLIQEFYNETNQNFYMYRTDKFVINAKEYLDEDFNVTEEQIQEVSKEVEHIRNIEEKVESDAHYIFADENFLVEPKNHDLFSNDDYFLKLINKNQLIDYLTESEKDLFLQMLSETHEVGKSKTILNFRYNRAVKFAMRNAIKRVEQELKDLMVELATLNKDDASKEKTHYFKLTTYDLDERIFNMLEGIDRIKERIKFLKAFPDGQL